MSTIKLLDEPVEQTMSINDRNLLQTYFNEINKIYKKNNEDYNIEYCEGNRDKLINMNLKTVIHIAKKYQGMGLSLHELISAGNLGLCIAYDKFDPSRNKLKNKILAIVDSKDDVLSPEDVAEVTAELSYGGLDKKLAKAFKNKEYAKKDVYKWIDKNIQTAKFNSVAAMWIKAYILLEIDNYSRLVKKPKAEIYKDKQETNSYKREILTEVGDKDMKPDYDEETNEVNVNDAYNTFKSNLAKLLDGVKNRDRILIMKKYGIGLPRPMLPKEIAEQEGLSIARISQIFQNVLDKMKANQAKYNISAEDMYEALEGMSN